LLVLDNCEHLVDASAELTETLMHASSTLRLLTTSREPLRVPGEVVWRVPSLTLPGPDLTKDLPELANSPAIRLFVERAQTVQPTFRLGHDNAAAIAALSARLEGLPLAIELTAAWVRVLGVEQVLQRLDATFRSELGGSRGATTRQQTMWATLDWSCALLDEPERVLLRRLAVFAGGWSLEVAENVCAGGVVARANILEHLTRLVDASLVQAQEQAGFARFRLLEPVRIYAEEHLAASGEDTALRQAHATAFLALGEQLSAVNQSGIATRSRLDRLELEHDNFRAALRWSRDSGSIEQGVRIAAAVSSLWLIRGHFSEGRRWIAALIDAPGLDTDPATLARVLGHSGNLAWYEGDAVTARLLHQRALGLYRTLPHAESGVAAMLDVLGLDAWSHGDYQDAENFCEEALTLARSQSLAWVERQAVYHLGLLAYDRMDRASAKERFTYLLVASQRVGDILGMARACSGLGQVAQSSGDYSGARAWQEKALVRRQQLGEPWGVALAEVSLASVLLDLGDLAAARLLLTESITLSQELGDRQGLARCLEAMACLAAVGHQPELALRLAGAAAALRDTSELPLSPANRVHLERHLEVARRVLGQTSAAAARESGYALSVEDAVALALLDGLAEGKENTRDMPATPAPASPLTQRQHEVALLVGQGLTNRQIADRLVITERTAAAHIEHILDKLGFTSRTQIGVWVAGNVPADSISRSAE
jgi:non-specific serine/threonine protein kinase